MSKILFALIILSLPIFFIQEDESKPYARPEWLKNWLGKNGYLLAKPVYMYNESEWTSVTGLVWFVMLLYAGYNLFTGSSDVEIIERAGGSTFLTIFVLLSIPYLTYQKYNDHNTDNELIVQAYKFSKFILNALCVLLGIGVVIIAYFWLNSSLEASSDMDQLQFIGAVIVFLLIYLIWTISKHNNQNRDDKSLDELDE